MHVFLCAVRAFVLALWVLTQRSMRSTTQARGLGAPRPALFVGLLIACLCGVLVSFAYLPRMLNMRMECRMSRMYPSYVVHDDQLREFSRSSSPLMHKYSLREYREASLFVPTKVNDRLLHVMPILFIPGNAGSFAQVRSMASSAFYQYWTSNVDGPRPDMDDVPGPTAWFAVDFNEDFSAFHGKTLEDQAFYVNEVVRYLRELYPAPEDQFLRGSERNMTVGIVGHSMGGIVARLAMSLPNASPSSIDTIVTLSTPHAFPPVPFERSMEMVYERIHRSINDDGPLVVSLAGGVLDTQLSSDAASLTLDDADSPPELRVSSFTTAVASLWSSVDHLAIVWCDQLRYRIARAFLRDYAHFGRDFRLRAQANVREQRRELWRLMLGITDDAARAEDKALSLATSDVGPAAKLMMAPNIIPLHLGGRDPIVLVNKPNARVEVIDIISPPGPRQMYVGDMSEEDEALAFELVTNYALGQSRDFTAPVPLTTELFISLCVRMTDKPLENWPTNAWCHPILPNGAERLPLSLDPTRSNDTLFPNAHILYDAPSATLFRVHLSNALLRMHDISAIRVEYTLDPAFIPTQMNVPTVLKFGWTEDKPLVLRGAPGWLSPKTWSLPGVNVTELLSSYVEHGPLWEWNMPDIDSSLLAYTFELIPAPCASRLEPPPPSTAPVARFISASTGDARVFPSLHTMSRNVMQVALHGMAPFMREPKHRGTRFQFWLLDDYDGTSFGGTYNANCPLPYAALRASVHWRASIGLLVLRYRLALLAWPLGVLALARMLTPPGADVRASPMAALFRLTHGRGLLILLLAPLALHVCVFFGASLGVPRYTLGIGITSLRFWWLGPVLAMLATSIAMLMCKALEMIMFVVYMVVRRVPRFLPSTAPPSRAQQWPSKLMWLAWAKQRTTWLTAIVVTALFVLLPYQVLILLCAMIHLYTTCRTYMAMCEAKRHVSSLHDTQNVWRLRYDEHAWLMQFLVWLLPLQAPVLVVWVRNVNAGVLMGFARTEHNVVAVAPLLVLIFLESIPWVLPHSCTFCYAHLHHVVYGTMSLCALLYGIRYSYTIFDVFLVTVVYEVARRIVPLYTGLAQAKNETIRLRNVAMLNVPTLNLDNVWEEYLATLDAYMQARSGAAQAMRDGFFQLARAKMSLGGAFGQRISQDAYCEGMSAQVRIQAPDNQGESTDTANAASTLRRRAPAGEEAGDVSADMSDTTRSPADPITQFSGLPPPSLRAAQRAFQRATTMLVDPAAPSSAHSVWHLQKKLEALERDIQQLRSS